jgi:3,4-dihydroxy 2-butanone 4-phosphate synthase/GTP cyclohydrolase II
MNAVTGKKPLVARGLVDVPTLLSDVKAGRPIILVDDESRENEGDLVIPADCITEEIVNFMIRQCGGFVCIALDAAIVDRLNLPLQPRRNVIANQAMFTVSIEARHGVSTGVSAADRVTTIRTAIAPQSGPDDLCVPGHVFPLRAQAGGVLARGGHTEAGVDIARLAGFTPAAVICEIMNDDGSMARLPDLIEFAERFNLNIGAIENLAAWRRKEKL